MSSVDTKALLDGVDLVALIDGYVPLKKAGAEFEACCPFHTESTPSFKVNAAKQFYNCFGCGANGDAIKFLQDFRGLSFLDACRELGAEIPEDENGPVRLNAPPAAIRRDPLKEKKPKTVWVPVHPVPSTAPPPPAAHPHRGLPQVAWCYRDAEGRPLGYVYRFVTSDGGKETLPLSWARAPTGYEEWRWLSFAEPRPLYGLDRLAAKPDATVLVVEGEKCADAGAAELPDLAVVSWPGGGKAVDKADWSPLAGRKVMTWADCDGKREPLTKDEKDALPDDLARAAAQAAKPFLPEAMQPGVRAMASVHRHLHALGARVWALSIPAPGEKPDGWDIADAVADGLQGEALAGDVRLRAQRVLPPGAIDACEATDAAPVGDSGGISPPNGAGAGTGDHDDDEWSGALWRRQLLRRDGKLIDCRENVYMMLRYHPLWAGVLWADEFAKRIAVRKPTPWDDPATFEADRTWEEVDGMRLGLWLAQRERLLIRSLDSIAAAVGWVASEQRFHPVREYLDGLAWDGVERLQHWLTDYLGVRATEYSALSGRFFLIGMVARVYRPGCQMRFMPILEGTQFRGKSSALRVLGGKWYGDAPIDLNNKDSYQLIQGCWLYEIAELDAFNKSDATRIKAFISQQSDRFRAPYERAPADWDRQGVFAGSTNQDEYFKDRTGNTRFWPWKVEEVEPMNIDGLSAAREQLLAEARERFMAGERWHPNADEQMRLFEPEQASREIADPWQSVVSRYLRMTTATRFTAADILTDALKIEVGKIDRGNQMAMAIGSIMKKLGWAKKRESGGDRDYYYERPREWIEAAAVKADQEAQEDAPF